MSRTLDNIPKHTGIRIQMHYVEDARCAICFYVFPILLTIYRDIVRHPTFSKCPFLLYNIPVRLRDDAGVREG